MIDRKKILFLSSANIFPPYWGGASRVYNLIKIISKDHDISLVCNDFRFLKKDTSVQEQKNEFETKTKVKVTIVKEMGPNSQIFNPRFIREALKIIKKEKPEIIITTSLYSAFHAIILKILTGRPYILDEHNVEFLRHERIYPNRRLPRLFLKTLEKVACRFASKIFCVSEDDRELLISRLDVKRDKITLIPNGVDTEKFFPNKRKNDEIKKLYNLTNNPIILFFGKLDYEPNLEAVKIIHKEILPRIIKKIQHAKFLIVGDNPPLEFKHEKILFTGLVDKIEDYINVSDVVICPLLSGGGTRLKILEALACEKIVISTKVGAEGIQFDKYQDILLIHDDWDFFSEEIIQSISKQGMMKNHDFYSISWKKSADDISKAIHEIVS